MSTHQETLRNTGQLIVHLIKEDLVYARLAESLEELGLNAGDYFQFLDETIFWMMGFREEELTQELKSWYSGQTVRGVKLSAEQAKDGLSLLAEEIYEGLKRFKEL